MDLIEETLASTKDFEAPKRFYYWSILSAISAVLKDKVWFNMGDNYNVYPNVYVLLYGPSGIRKGPPIALAEDLVSRVNNTRVIDGRSSIQAVIKTLGTYTTKPGGVATPKDCCGFMVASELSSSIIGDNSAMDIMTNLYDRLYNEKEWNYRLKVGESVSLKKPTITWLAGTNEALFKDFVPEKNLHGGLIGRMFIITETRKNTTNSLMFKTVSPDKVRLSNILKHIAALEGEFKMEDGVRDVVDAWYNRFDKDIAPGLKDETGFVSRVLDFVIKISILIAAGRRQEKILLINDVTEALENVVPLVDPTKRVVAAVKKADHGEMKKRSLVLNYLSNQPEFKAERSKILRNLGLQVNHEDLDKIVQYMFDMGVAKQDTSGGTITYALKVDKPEIMEWIKQFRS